MEPGRQPPLGRMANRPSVVMLTVVGLMGVVLGAVGYSGLLTTQAHGSPLRLGAGVAAGLVVVGGITAAVVRTLALRLTASR
jgi:hypothetical protein